jgi:hypothetical protein
MTKVLLIIAGVLLGLLLLGFLAWSWIKGKLRRLLEAIGGMLGASAVPPFRITLETKDATEWQHPAEIDTATRAFLELGYERVDDFDIEEISDVSLRGFWHPTVQSFAVVYDHIEIGAFADVVGFLVDGTHVTFTSAPLDGLDQPDYSRKAHLDVRIGTSSDAARQMHARLLSECRGLELSPTRREDFSSTFESAYAREMDWRIERNGVTADEVRGAALAGGQSEPNDHAVSVVQSLWRASIDSFIQEQVHDRFRKDASMSAAEWDDIRDRILVVHERSDRDDLVDSLAHRVAEDRLDDLEDGDAEERELLEARNWLASHFAESSVVDGFAAAQSALPEARRYKRVHSLEQPWRADVYLDPTSDLAIT